MNDKELIMKLGGVNVVSNYLGLSYQCVFNWLSRGIPAQVKIDNREIMLIDNPQPIQKMESVEHG